MKRNAIWFSIVLLTMTGTFFSCVPQPVPFFGGGAVVVQFMPVFDGEEVVFNNGDEYVLNGKTITFEDFKFYISNIVLEDENGVFTDLSEIRLIKFENLESSSLIIDNIPVGEYRSVQFDLGVPASENLSTWDPERYGGNHPLNDESLYAIDLESYKFLVLTGVIDDSGRKRFVYDPGNNSIFQNDKIINTRFTLTSELATTINIEVDLNMILDNIDVANEPRSTAANNLSLGANMMRNLRKAIREKQ